MGFDAVALTWVEKFLILVFARVGAGHDFFRQVS